MNSGLDALYRTKDPSAAVVQFRKVLELNPNHYGATYQLAMALDRTGKPAEARVLWEKVLRMAEGYKDQDTLAAAKTRLARTP
jgi:Flp pilus assembly protein TadD